MPGLRDIAPLKEHIRIRGDDLDIVGLNLASIAYLWGRFPQIAAIAGRGELSAVSIINLGADVVAAIIAAGTGAPGDEETELAAKQLTIDEELEIIAAILKVSMGRGGGPFGETLLQIAKALGMTAPTDQSALKGGRSKTSTKSPEPLSP